jgi:hypothetical protein
MILCVEMEPETDLLRMLGGLRETRVRDPARVCRHRDPRKDRDDADDNEQFDESEACRVLWFRFHVRWSDFFWLSSACRMPRPREE